MKLFASIALAILMGTVGRAAQIGDSVEQIVTVENRITLPTQQQPTEITHIVLDSGVWSISGQVNVLSLSQAGRTLFTAANISIGTPSFEPDGTASIQAERVGGAGNIIRPMALAARIVEVNNGTSVFLVGGIFNPNNLASGWGFITAVKIRNHVD